MIVTTANNCMMCLSRRRSADSAGIFALTR